jgi:hypothetical protein
MSEYSEDIEMIWNDDGFNELGFPSCRGVGTISDIAWETHVEQKSDFEISSHNHSKIPWLPSPTLPGNEIAVNRHRNLLIEQIIQKNPSIGRVSLENEKTRTLQETADNMGARKERWFLEQ